MALYYIATSPQEVDKDHWIFIGCGANQYIRILSAVYDNPPCDNPTDISTDATLVVERECENLHECSFYVEDDFFGGDTCNGPNEFLHVPYTKKLICCIAHILAKTVGK